jgi:hypothetical protein
LIEKRGAGLGISIQALCVNSQLVGKREVMVRMS